MNQAITFNNAVVGFFLNSFNDIQWAEQYEALVSRCYEVKVEGGPHTSELYRNHSSVRRATSLDFKRSLITATDAAPHAKHLPRVLHGDSANGHNRPARARTNFPKTIQANDGIRIGFCRRWKHGACGNVVHRQQFGLQSLLEAVR